MKEEKGITLVALIITIVVLLILATVSIQSGTESLDSTRLQGFYTQLEIVQKRVDDIAETNENYVDSEGNIVYIKEQGVAYNNLTQEQQISLQGILNSENIDIAPSNFRYFTAQNLEDILDLMEMEYNVYIDFENRVIIAADGIVVGDKTYYVLKNTTYFVEEDTTKNTGTIVSLNYNVVAYSKDKYKVTVTPSNIIGDLDGTGFVKYKKTITKYWETSSNNEMVLESNVEYDIIYQDSNNNTIEKVIKVELDAEGTPAVTEV